MNKVLKYSLLVNCIFIGWAMMAQAYEVIDVRNGTTINGKATFSGTVPDPLWFDVDKNPEVCGQRRNLTKIHAKDGLLRGVVVMLEGVKSGKPFPQQERTSMEPGKGMFRYTGGVTLGLKVNAENCNFGPYTGVLTPDEAVGFVNQDSIKHVLHTFASLDTQGSVLRTVHNRDLHPNREIQRTFSQGKLRESRVVRLTCNRHDFMQNWLYVVKNPYFAVSDENGNFSIDNIPPGQYILKAWHPMLGLQERELQVPEGTVLATDFVFSE